MTGPQAPDARPVGRWNRGLLIAPLVIAVLAAIVVVSFRLGSSGSPAGPATARPSPSAEGNGPLTVAEIYEVMIPSVVSIRTTGATAGSGTGVIANDEGIILTALHVVQGAGSIEVTFADGTRSAATILAAAPEIDIAALAAATPPSIVVPAVLGGGAGVGDEVVAIGNQLGLPQSTTAGVVSGLGRSVGGAGGTDLDGLIQFDAAVNPGSSGGPLVNTRGQTVGIVVALANPTDAGTFIGIGFAVPIGAAAGVGAGEDQVPQR